MKAVQQVARGDEFRRGGLYGGIDQRDPGRPAVAFDRQAAGDGPGAQRWSGGLTESVVSAATGGGGKSHLAAAIGLGLVENGRRVLFARTSDLVQRLQVTRRELALESAIARLDKYHLLVLDDLAYVTKDQAETSVLFELEHFNTRVNRWGLNEAAARHWDCFACGAPDWKVWVAETPFQTGAFRWPIPALCAAA